MHFDIIFYFLLISCTEGQKEKIGVLNKRVLCTLILCTLKKFGNFCEINERVQKMCCPRYNTEMCSVKDNIFVLFLTQLFLECTSWILNISYTKLPFWFIKTA